MVDGCDRHFRQLSVSVLSRFYILEPAEVWHATSPRKSRDFFERITTLAYYTKKYWFFSGSLSKFLLFIMKRAPSRSWKTQREIFVCCPIYTNFSDLQRSSLTLSTCKKSFKSEKFSCFNYRTLLGHKKREILICLRRKISTFYRSKLGS